MSNEFAKHFATHRNVIAVIDRELLFMLGGDANAALVFSQILFWSLPDKQGRPKLKVRHDDEKWLSRSTEEWKKALNFKRSKVDTALKKLASLKLIEMRVYKFNGSPTRHYRIRWGEFEAQYNDAAKAILRDSKRNKAEQWKSRRKDTLKLDTNLVENELFHQSKIDSSYNRDYIRETTTENTIDIFTDSQSSPVTKALDEMDTRELLIEIIYEKFGRHFAQGEAARENKVAIRLAALIDGSNGHTTVQDAYETLQWKLRTDKFFVASLAGVLKHIRTYVSTVKTGEARHGYDPAQQKLDAYRNQEKNHDAITAAIVAADLADD